nr:helix-turn-helix domain-containing protein [Caballeronia temeraria]
MLDAAEVDFSQRGYAGASFKEVVASCGVTQALITYYFGTKLLTHPSLSVEHSATRRRPSSALKGPERTCRKAYGATVQSSFGSPPQGGVEPGMMRSG